MSQLDKFIPVYASPHSKEIKYYFSSTSSDCPICMSFHKDPLVTNCGHTFCKKCLENSLEHTTLCPICYFYISDTYIVKWLWYNEIKKNDFVTFVKVRYKDGENVSNLITNPFSRKYFVDGDGYFTDWWFYQVSDGGLYFLDVKVDKWGRMPELIAGVVKSEEGFDW